MRLFTLLLATAILLAACGAPTPTPAVAPTVALQETAVVSPTSVPEAPTTTAGATAAAGQPTPVEVILADNTIESSLTDFRAGESYEFTIKNEGRHVHNFNINEPVETAGSLDDPRRHRSC